MSVISLSPSLVINALALLSALPGAWLLHTTRRRERQQLERLAERIEVTPFDEPMPFLGCDTRRMIRSGYRIGAACLASALALSWASTHF